MTNAGGVKKYTGCVEICLKWCVKADGITAGGQGAEGRVRYVKR